MPDFDHSLNTHIPRSDVPAMFDRDGGWSHECAWASTSQAECIESGEPGLYEGTGKDAKLHIYDRIPHHNFRG